MFMKINLCFSSRAISNPDFQAVAENNFFHTFTTMKISNVSYNYNYILVANRYYNPRISQFYATDPLAEKYPGITPYVYTKDNPVVLLDTDGKDDYYFDILKQHIHIVKNGKPNRYFIARYKVEQERIENTVFINYDFSKWEPHSINDAAIRNLDINGKSVYEYALYHAYSCEQYADIYNSYDSIDEMAIIKPIMAVAAAPLLVEGAIAVASSEAIAALSETSMEIASNTTLEGAISNVRNGMKIYDGYSLGKEIGENINKGDLFGVTFIVARELLLRKLSGTLNKTIDNQYKSRITEQGLKLLKDLHLKLIGSAGKTVFDAARKN